MHTIVPAVLEAATPGSVQLASFPTEPQALFVYVLLVVAGVVMWRLNRSGGESPPAPGDSGAAEGEEPGSGEAAAPRRRGRGKKNPRPPGHINWVQ